ncbi:MAG: AzlD domain-containing protein [Phototrophicaceae bacterium]
MNDVIMIFGMFVVTFGVRYGSLAITQRMPLSPAVMRALRYVPVAVLTALTIPFIAYRENGLDLSLQNPYWGAGIVTIVCSALTKNLILTIIVGMGAFFLWRMVLGS